MGIYLRSRGNCLHILECLARSARPVRRKEHCFLPISHQAGHQSLVAPLGDTSAPSETSSREEKLDKHHLLDVPQYSGLSGVSCVDPSFGEGDCQDFPLQPFTLVSEWSSFPLGSNTNMVQ